LIIVTSFSVIERIFPTQAAKYQIKYRFVVARLGTTDFRYLKKNRITGAGPIPAWTQWKDPTIPVEVLSTCKDRSGPFSVDEIRFFHPIGKVGLNFNSPTVGTAISWTFEQRNFGLTDRNREKLRLPMMAERLITTLWYILICRKR
jgi:hypothetical protein